MTGTLSEALTLLKECSSGIEQLNNDMRKLPVAVPMSMSPPKYITKKVLSWDCGLKSSSWALLTVRIPSAPHRLHIADIDLVGCGTIDFLEDKKVKSVREDLWPSMIKSGLAQHAPTIETDCLVVIESQPQRFTGSITLGNTATQFCIAFHYADHPITFIDAKKKNMFGPLSKGHVAELTGLSGEPLRKKHTRLNFELYMLMRYNKKYKRGSGIKMRDVSDAFMQGLYFATSTSVAIK
jgi:hypothetical protein